MNNRNSASAPGLFPCGKSSRRELVWEMGNGFAGLALLSLLAGDQALAAGPSASSSSLLPKKPHFPTKAKSCIFLTMNGAPSHIDTFDHKPALEKYAGQELPPSFKYTNSGGRKRGFLTPSFRPFRPGGDSGLMTSDYFPHVRKHADKLAILRACHTDSHAHGSALVALKLVVIGLLIFFTSPVATHALARAALHRGLEPWKR